MCSAGFRIVYACEVPPGWYRLLFVPRSVVNYGAAYPYGDYAHVSKRIPVSWVMPGSAWCFGSRPRPRLVRAPCALTSLVRAPSGCPGGAGLPQMERHSGGDTEWEFLSASHCAHEVVPAPAPTADPAGMATAALAPAAAPAGLPLAVPAAAAGQASMASAGPSDLAAVPASNPGSIYSVPWPRSPRAEADPCHADPCPSMVGTEHREALLHTVRSLPLYVPKPTDEPYNAWAEEEPQRLDSGALRQHTQLMRLVLNEDPWSRRPGVEPFVPAHVGYGRHADASPHPLDPQPPPGRYPQVQAAPAPQPPPAFASQPAPGSQPASGTHAPQPHQAQYGWYGPAQAGQAVQTDPAPQPSPGWQGAPAMPAAPPAMGQPAAPASWPTAAVPAVPTPVPVPAFAPPTALPLAPALASGPAFEASSAQAAVQQLQQLPWEQYGRGHGGPICHLQNYGVIVMGGGNVPGHDLPWLPPPLPQHAGPVAMAPPPAWAMPTFTAAGRFHGGPRQHSRRAGCPGCLPGPAGCLGPDRSSAC